MVTLCLLFLPIFFSFSFLYILCTLLLNTYNILNYTKPALHTFTVINWFAHRVFYTPRLLVPIVSITHTNFAGFQPGILATCPAHSIFSLWPPSEC